MTTPDWITPLFDAIDDQNTDGFVSFLAKDAHVRFGNGPTMKGKDAIFDGIEQFFSLIDSLSHDLSNIWSVDGAVVVEGQVTYDKGDDTTLTFPFCNVLHLDDNSTIERYYVYVDQSPLFETLSD